MIRHAQSIWNASGQYQGQTDVPLSALGEAQAQALAQRLAGQAFAAVYSSDLQRAKHTAQVVAQALSGAPEVACLPELREIAAGRLAGLTSAEISAKHPEYVQQLNADPWHTVRPDGESMEQLLQRTGGILHKLCHHRERVLVFTHGGVVRTAVALALGLSGASAISCARLNVGNTSITRILLPANVKAAGTLLSFNDQAHLEEAGLTKQEG